MFNHTPQNYLDVEWPGANSGGSYKQLSELSAPNTILKNYRAPMLLKTANQLPVGREWSYEFKLDGWRGIGVKDSDTCALSSKQMKPLTQFPEIIEQLAELRCRSAVLDGEITALDDKNFPCLWDLVTFSFRKGKSQLVYQAFDLLHLDGKDLRGVPLLKRKELLKNLLAKSNCGMLYVQSMAHTTNVARLLEVVSENNLEGIVAKNVNSFYQPGCRSENWQKFKPLKIGQFYIGGYSVDSKGILQSLRLGEFHAKDFVYRAKVSFGFSSFRKKNLPEILAPLKLASSPFARRRSTEGKPRAGFFSKSKTSEQRNPPHVYWVKPTFKAEISYREYDDNGIISNASFVALESK